MLLQLFTKRLISVSVLLLLGLSAAGCLATVEADTRDAAAQNSSMAQMLPIEAKTTLGSETIFLEVARTPRQQGLGLMYRTELPPTRGMLFPFDPPRRVNFWMKNVAINLDMIFLRDSQIVAIAADVPPCTQDPCPLYGPAEPVDGVIELAGGRAAQLGLEVGDRAPIEYLDTPRE